MKTTATEKTYSIRFVCAPQLGVISMKDKSQTVDRYKVRYFDNETKEPINFYFEVESGVCPDVPAIVTEREMKTLAFTL